MGESISSCCSTPKKDLQVATITNNSNNNHEASACRAEAALGPANGFHFTKSPPDGLAPARSSLRAKADSHQHDDSEYVFQEDPSLLGIQVDGLKLATGSAKFVEPERMKEYQGNKQIFTFGRSESKVEELLRNAGSAQDARAVGTYIVQTQGGKEQPPPSKQARSHIRFAETAELTVVIQNEAQDNGVGAADSGNGDSAAHGGNAQPLSLEAVRTLTSVFERFDSDGSREITMAEAVKFWGKGFSKISAGAMFAEVDVDGSGAINLDEFITFWQNVKRNGYSEKEILEELQELVEGGMWVDWKDGRCTGKG